MCRSTSDGGRRCTGNSRSRTRALGTARKAVERARHTAKQARAAGDPDAIAAAEAKLTAAKQRLTDARAAYPRTPATGQPQGHDTAKETAMPEDTGTAKGRAAAADDETPGHRGGTTSDAGFVVQPGQSFRLGDNVFHNRGSDSIQVGGPGNHTDVNNAGDVSTRARTETQRNPEAPSRARARAERDGEERVNRTSFHAGGATFVHGGVGDTYLNGERITSTGAEGRDNPQVTSHTAADGSTFVNYAAPGAHVGEQHGAVYGDFTISADQHTAGEMPPGLADTIRLAHEAAARAQEQAHHHQASNRSTTNTTSGNDGVHTQIGAIYGGTFHDHTDQ